MKKLFTLIMLFGSICMSAQTLEGDVNKDGKLTIEDVTKVIDLYLNYEEPSGPDVMNHAYVDLGLPSGTKWATCNVGASSPEEYGDYFAWGETKPKSEYNWSTYKWCVGSTYAVTKLNKYCTNKNLGNVDNKTFLDPEDDAAHVNWGGDWRMPMPEELDELRNISYCDWTWTSMNGIMGYKVISKLNGNSIFLPAAGYCDASGLCNTNCNGSYWSSSIISYPDFWFSSLSSDYYSNFAYTLGFTANLWKSTTGRFVGQSVRPVCK